MRVSLAPSAAADAAAGIVLGAAAWPEGAAPWLLIAGSLAVYHGGMTLNDWADRAEDARLRPERPIPSGAIGAPAALAIAVALLAGGPLLAAFAAPAAGALLAAVAVLAALYDVAGRGPWIGPALLAACRMGNLGSGVLLGASVAGGASSPPTAAPWLVLCYGLYVFAVSRLGRLEDTERAHLGGAPRGWLALALVAFCLAPFAPEPASGRPALDAHSLAAAALLVAGGFGLARIAIATERWSPRAVLPAMGMALRRLLVFTAAAALLSRAPEGWLVAPAILAGFPASWALRRAFPPS